MFGLTALISFALGIIIGQTGHVYIPTGGEMIKGKKSPKPSNSTPPTITSSLLDINVTAISIAPTQPPSFNASTISSPPTQPQQQQQQLTLLCSPSAVRRKKVLFVQVSTMDVFKRPDVSHSGEEYVTACLDWALRRMGVEVHRYHHSWEDLPIEYLSDFDRIFRNGLEWHPQFEDHPEVACKTRPLHFWGNGFYDPPRTNYTTRQILAPYPDELNTFLGFFPHLLVEPDRIEPNPYRNKEGLIIGKNKEYFVKDPGFLPSIQHLIDNGFVLHSTCHNDDDCGLPSGVLNHHALTPDEFANLVAKMAFAIGAGESINSPSPLIALAQGAAWLNPIKGDENRRNATKEFLRKTPRRWEHPSIIETQHTPLTLLGAPYVYNIDLTYKDEVLQAANRAVRYRFSSYTPPELKPNAMIDRVCSIMEDNVPCDCSRLKEKYKAEDPDWDCNGLTKVMNPQ